MRRDKNDNPMPPDVYSTMLIGKRSNSLGHSESGVYQLHHAVVDKGLVMKMPLEERRKIHNVCNLLWVPQEWNVSHANVPPRAEAYAILCAREGKANVDAWLLSINFKVRPFTLESLQGDQ